MTNWTDKSVLWYLDTFKDHCVIFDVSKCREASITRIYNTLRAHTSAIEKVERNTKCILIRHLNPCPKKIRLVQNSAHAEIFIPDDCSIADFVETYMTNDFIPPT